MKHRIRLTLVAIFTVTSLSFAQQTTPPADTTRATPSVTADTTQKPVETKTTAGNNHHKLLLIIGGVLLFIGLNLLLADSPKKY